jgi:hypothetical protein
LHGGVSSPKGSNPIGDTAQPDYGNNAADYEGSQPEDVSARLLEKERKAKSSGADGSNEDAQHDEDD